MLLTFYEMHVPALGLQTPHHLGRPIWRFIVNYQDMHIMPYPDELILQRPDYFFYVFALIKCRKYDYRFQREISFLSIEDINAPFLTETRAIINVGYLKSGLRARPRSLDKNELRDLKKVLLKGIDQRFYHRVLDTGACAYRIGRAVRGKAFGVAGLPSAGRHGVQPPAARTTCAAA
jgi:hypothetical protein